MALFVGLDPSFNEYGVSLINTDTKTIILDSFNEKINQKKNRSVLESIPILMKDLDDRIFSTLLQNQNNHISIGLELDVAVTAWNQAICYALDYATYDRLKYFTSDINLYTTYYIGYVQYYLQKEAVTINPWLDKKLYTIYLVEELLRKFEDEGWVIKKCQTEKNTCGPKVGNRYPKKETITSGEADSFILALRQFVKEGYTLEKFDLHNYLPKLFEDKEID